MNNAPCTQSLYRSVLLPYALKQDNTFVGNKEPIHESKFNSKRVGKKSKHACGEHTIDVSSNSTQLW